MERSREDEVKTRSLSDRELQLVIDGLQNEHTTARLLKINLK